MKDVTKELVVDVESVTWGLPQAFAKRLVEAGTQAAKNADGARYFARRCDTYFGPNDPNRDFYDVLISEALAASQLEQREAENCIDLAWDNQALVSSTCN